MEPDFSGYATKANLKCSDGRVIKASAFKHMDGETVPLVWQHARNSPDNVLGHVRLEARDDGMYTYGFFNDTPNGQHAKKAVQHGDIDSLSIYANQVKEVNKVVSHGNIREVSLVLSGANPGAKIDYVRLQHSEDPEDYVELEDEVIISHMGEIELPKSEDENEDEGDEGDEDVTHAETDEKNEDEETVQDVYESMNEKQKQVVHYMVGAALEEAKKSGEADTEAEHSDDTDEGIDHQEKEGSTDVGRNVFDQSNTDTKTDKHVISHSDIKAIFEDGKKRGSFREAVQEYVIQHGIEDVEILFPDAKAIYSTPEFDKRRTEWVSTVLGQVRKTPFARIKTITADITQDQARAKGYIKGNYKREEWFGVTKRTTDPTTVYKKQKLDRDDILDITDFDVVAWLMAEMRLMLEEEIARAILIGDGRDMMDEDKVKDPAGASSGPGIRSILNDHELFVTTLYVNVDDANSNYEEVVDAVMDGMQFYKGTGTPTFFTTVKQLNMFKKARDGEQRRIYKTNAEVAEALGVDRIVTVEPMAEVTDLVGIIVNLSDYNLGTNAGGELTKFEDFDIDYNQYKYLMETRLSGALTKVKTALVIKKTAPASVLATPLKPSFVKSTGVVTIPSVTGVVYKDSDGETINAGAMSAIPEGTSVTIYSEPASGYHFANNQEDSWQFYRPAS